MQPAIQDLLLALRERLTRVDEFSQSVMALAENINGRVKDLERPAKPKAATPPQHSAATQPPRSETSRNRPIPPEVVEEAARLWDGGKGPSIPQIIAAKGWPHHRGALGKRVKRYLEQASDQADPASHGDENPAPPVEPLIATDPSG